MDSELPPVLNELNSRIETLEEQLAHKMPFGAEDDLELQGKRAEIAVEIERLKAEYGKVQQELMDQEK